MNCSVYQNIQQLQLQQVQNQALQAIQELQQQAQQEIQQEIIQNQLNQLYRNSFSFEFYLHVNFYISKLEISAGPRFEHNVGTGNNSLGLKTCLSLSFDRSNDEWGKNGLGGSFSASKGNFKATAAADTDLSQSSPEYSFTVQTRTPNQRNVGIQVKGNDPSDVFLFAPSNVVKNGKLVVLQNEKFDYGQELEATTFVMPFNTVRNKAGSESTNKKHIETKSAVTETGAKKNETQKFHQYIQAPSVPAYDLRNRPTIINFSLVVVLAWLFLLFVKKLVVFLRTKRIK